MIPATKKWVRSSYCATGGCIEVSGMSAEVIAVRDSKNPDQPPLYFSRADWHEFLDRVADSARSIS
ncbi:DUF397 domain-containing protein [Actinoplanes sp. G11-F43]|uniref:DUF397 domain-containing protein n=1 Tax=Actinoplanes sp. G11-F43 TaxID=3424130 RepID=UPI003D32B150